MNIKKVLQSGDVVRYHNHIGMDKQLLSTHQWGVALIMQYIYPECSKEAILEALTHDVGEYHTGDVPAPVKWRNLNIREVIENMELEFKNKLDLWWAKDIEPMGCDALKVADTLEGMWYCVQQLQNGMKAARRPFRKWQGIIEANHKDILERYPKAKALYDLIVAEKEKWS